MSLHVTASIRSPAVVASARTSELNTHEGLLDTKLFENIFFTLFQIVGSTVTWDGSMYILHNEARDPPKGRAEEPWLR